MTCAIQNYPAEDEQWTISRIIDELYLCLISIREDNDGITRKYEKQAKNLLLKIGLWNPPPAYIIYLNDLNNKIKKELYLNFKSLNYVMIETITRIFEGLDIGPESITFDEPWIPTNNRYFLLNIRRNHLLQWKIE